MSDFVQLPADLPAPGDDGAADHLPGLALPDLRVPATDGGEVALTTLGYDGRGILYCYPMTGRPGSDLPEDWDQIPGARGCTPEACSFRDHHAELLEAGASTVHGVSSQDTAYQREVADRLKLPFTMLADPDLRLAAALRLPTFETDGMRLYTRLTMVIREARIEHVFYPVFPPDRHAGEVLAWLRRN
jgi:peroxiredoxin